MVNRRKFLGYAGLIGAGFTIGLQRKGLSEEVQDFEWDLDLESFSYEVPSIDAKGKIKQLQPYEGFYFAEDLGRNESLRMVAIPPGTLTMGSRRGETRRKQNEALRRGLQIDPFFLGQYPITQSQWESVAQLPRVNVDLNPDPSYFKAPDHPVENVSWDEAIEFCDRLSQRTGRQYRLASEMEWEYACRAGKQTPFSTGETISSEFANYIGTQTYREEKKGIYRRSTSPVGSFSPNAFGLYDLHGNVWEWSADEWHDTYQKTSRYRGSLRALRGGSWMDSPDKLRSASRVGNLASIQSRVIGFRVACT